MAENNQKKRRPTKVTHSSRILAKQREERAVELRLQGWKLTDIAKEVGYRDHAGVRVALLRCIARIPTVENVVELRQREIAMLDEVEREAWEQWHRSTEDAETVTASGGDGKKKSAITTKREGQSGNPALLEKIIKCSERRSKLLGLDAPQQFDVRKASIRTYGADELAKARMVMRAIEKQLKHDNALGLEGPG